MPIERIIHKENPFEASREADDEARREADVEPARTRFFAEREVLKPDGTFPFGEGHLYVDSSQPRRDSDWMSGVGKPGRTSEAGDKGSKHEQQDAFGAWRFQAGDYRAAAVVAADGVSASGELASSASKKAVDVFMSELRRRLRDVPRNENARHAFVEKAMSEAAFVANFEVVRQVLFDRARDGAYDRSDKADLRRETGVDLPAGPLSPHEIQALAPRLDTVIEDLAQEEVTALTTFAAAITIDNDVYTFSSGDAVISLFRPSQPPGERLIHLTHRDQQVVEIFTSGEDHRRHGRVYQNVITKSLGASAEVSGTIRRYANLLEPGDRLVASSDGLGPRGPGRGLDRRAIEEILAGSDPDEAAAGLVRGQLSDLDPDEYQDNVGVALLAVV